MIYDCARVSRDGQSVNAQVKQLRAALADAWADTTTAHGRLMLTVLGGVAEFERELIPTRASDGRSDDRGKETSPRSAAAKM